MRWWQRCFFCSYEELRHNSGCSWAAMLRAPDDVRDRLRLPRQHHLRSEDSGHQRDADHSRAMPSLARGRSSWTKLMRANEPARARGTRG
jgi:hypothetical protein